MWGDFIVFVGNVVFELMGFEMFGFVGGCVDDYVGDKVFSWGFEDEWEMIFFDCFDEDGNFKELFGNIVMGFIYVNFEGFNGEFDFEGFVKNICEMFSGMVMNDKEIVVFIVGGYIFGKVYGVDFGDNFEVEFEVVFIEE